MVKFVILIALLSISLSYSAPTQESGVIEKREANPHHGKKLAVIKLYGGGHGGHGHKRKYVIREGGYGGGGFGGGGGSFSQAQSSSFSHSFSSPVGSFAASGSQSSSGAFGKK
ncbi:glycine-rich cell wall structural protein-like [Cimex lectularius]|uniref:CPR type cuticle protein n=1 Tax=Cimex lectularius TaxID=79782 RepID=A0A8I6S3H9_CIMLE|nr:glycine-rich cell wall structural protein-like [Cimex lectularius]